MNKILREDDRLTVKNYKEEAIDVILS